MLSSCRENNCNCGIRLTCARKHFPKIYAKRTTGIVRSRFPKGQLRAGANRWQLVAGRSVILDVLPSVRPRTNWNSVGPSYSVVQRTMGGARFSWGKLRGNDIPSLLRHMSSRKTFARRRGRFTRNASGLIAPEEIFARGQCSNLHHFDARYLNIFSRDKRSVCQRSLHAD